MSQQHSDSDQPDVVGLEYLNGLYSYAMMLTRNREDAEDLVQETYLRSLSTKTKVVDNPRSWMFTILRNAWLNQLRKRRNHPQLIVLDDHTDVVDDSPASRYTNPHSFYVSNWEIEEVQKAIRRLALESQEILLLREYQELSYREIADILDCPVGTVMSRLWRARRELRAELNASKLFAT